MIKLAIVSPCYNEEELIEESSSRLLQTIENLVSNNKVSEDSFILFVNDGSSDSTWQLIQEMHHSDNRICGINLTRNVGHQNAIMAGMMTVRDKVDALITIDVDLQDDLNAIEKMIDLNAAGAEIVYGVKKQRNADSFFKRNTAKMFYAFQEKCGVRSIENHADFRLMSKLALDALSEYKERNIYLRGIIPLLGLNSAKVCYDLSPRTKGESKYTFSKMMYLAIDGITSFSIRPFYFIMMAGFIMLGIAVCILIYVIISILLKCTNPGWASIMISLWFIGSILTLSIGIFGIYIGKIYIEVKRRPRYQVGDVLI